MIDDGELLVTLGLLSH